MRFSFKTLTAAALALGGAAVMQSAPASAQNYRGVPVNDGGYQRYMAVNPMAGGGGYAAPRAAYRPAAGAYGWGGGYRPAYGGYRPAYYGGYRPAYYRGYRPAYYGGYGYPYGYRRGYDGGAVAAGLIGGLALGAIASAATAPYYYNTPGYYRPAYYAPARTCVTERRRIVNRYGRAVVRRVQTCY